LGLKWEDQSVAFEIRMSKLPGGIYTWAPHGSCDLRMSESNVRYTDLI